MKTSEVDILVIGGGIAGCSVAYHLAMLGHAVSLLEANSIASGASGLNAGTIWSLGRGHVQAFPSSLASGSLAILEQIESNHGGNLDCRRCGALKCIQTEEERIYAETWVAEHRRSGFEVELLDTAEMIRREPALSPKLLGAVHYPLASAVDPLKATKALAAAAVCSGVKLWLGREVTAIHKRNTGFLIRSGNRCWNAQQLVLAAGAFTARLGLMLGINLNVAAVRGQMWSTPSIPKRLSHIIGAMESALFWRDHRTEPVLELTHSSGVPCTRHLYGLQRSNGEVVFGGARQVILTAHPDSTALELNRRHCIEILPFLADLPPCRSWVGWMPFTPELIPMIGPVTGHSALYILTGLFSAGFESAPMAGKILAEIIHSGEVPSWLPPILPSEPLDGNRCSLSDFRLAFTAPPKSRPIFALPRHAASPIARGEFQPCEGILSAIGNTPLVRLRHLFPSLNCRVFAKMEGFNPGGSSKDRAAQGMLQRALANGAVGPETTVIESSSGNMAIGLAQSCLALGLRFLCVVDSSISPQHLRILRAYGAEIDLLDGEDATFSPLEARIRRVQQHLAELPRAYWLNQYANEANSDAHKTTMAEIVNGLASVVDYIFVPVSTCGTLRGCYEYVRSHGMSTRIVAVDALGSAIFSSDQRPRRITGHGASRRPELYQAGIADSVALVSDEECILGCHLLLRREAILAGGSSGAVVAALRRMGSSISDDAVCVLLLPDRGERYCETIYSEQWVARHFPDSVRDLISGNFQRCEGIATL